MRLADLQTPWRHLNAVSVGIEMSEIKTEEKFPWLTHLFTKAGLDLRLFYIAVPRAKGDLIGEPAHLIAAITAIVCEAISTASASAGINILLVATLLRAPALLPSWKQMLDQTWIRLLLLWLLWMAISITWSPDVAKGIDRFGTLKYFIWIPLLWPLYKQWCWLFAAFLLSAFILQCTQVSGAFGAMHQGVTLIKGFRHATTAGIWDATALSCWLFLAVAVNWRAMLLCIPMAVLSAVGFVWAGQRAALWGILVEIIIANIVLVFAVRGWLRRTLLRVMLGMIVIGGVYFFIGQELTNKLKQVYNETTKDLTAVESGSKSNDGASLTYEERIAMWKMSIIAWRAHPIMGVGYGGYSKATAPIDDVKHPTFDVHMYDHPHSTFVMILTENGLVGLTLFLLWIGAFFVRAFRVVQLDPIRIGVFGGAVIWLAAAVGDSFHTREMFLNLGLFMMAMAAMPSNTFVNEK
jgi:O-antigen ligase